MCAQTLLHNCMWSVVKIAGNLLVKLPIVLTTFVVLLGIRHQLIRYELINYAGCQIRQASNSCQFQIAMFETSQHHCWLLHGYGSHYLVTHCTITEMDNT